MECYKELFREFEGQLSDFDWAQKQGVLFPYLTYKRNSRELTKKEKNILEIGEARNYEYKQIKKIILDSSSNKVHFIKGDELSVVLPCSYKRYSHDLDGVFEDLNDFLNAIVIAFQHGYTETFTWIRNPFDGSNSASVKLTKRNLNSENPYDDFALEFHFKDFPISEFTSLNPKYVNSNLIIFLSNITNRDGQKKLITLKDMIDAYYLFESEVHDVSKLTELVKDNHLSMSLFILKNQWIDNNSLKLPSLLVKLCENFEEMNAPFNIYDLHSKPWMRDKGIKNYEKVISTRLELDAKFSGEKEYYSDEVAQNHLKLGVPVYGKLIDINATSLEKAFKLSLLKYNPAIWYR
ncbi:hypothetical protein L5164_003777 [Vibrio parahaemolyticus]|nr:hypothetical protein [Vibrio parahaemolyticus]